MANKDFLEERVKSFEDKIEKSKAIIEKKTALIQKKEAELTKLTDEREIYWKEADIRYLNMDIAEHERKIEKEYQPAIEKYTVELEKILSIKRDIPVLVEFLDKWKEAAYNFYIEDAQSEHRKNLKAQIAEAYKVMMDYYKEHRCDVYLSDFKSDVYKEYRRLTEEHDNIAKAYRSEYSYILAIEERAKSKNTSFEVELDKDLQEEWEAKYDRLIKDTERVVGKIKDCSYLEVSSRGELNGTVIGEKGKAKVTTFLAGHYHKEYSWQQCLHYRMKITKISEK